MSIVSERESKVIIRGFGIGGYRSFAQEIQWLDPLSQVNVIMGENNLGKSNLLFFIAQEYRLTVERVQYESPVSISDSDLNENVHNCMFQFGLSLKGINPGKGLFNREISDELINCLIAQINESTSYRIAFEYSDRSKVLSIPSAYVESVFNVMSESDWYDLAYSFSGERYNNDNFENARYSIRRVLDFQKNKPHEKLDTIFIPAKRETNKSERLGRFPNNCIIFDGSGLGKLIAEHKNPGDDRDIKFPLYEKMLSIVRYTMGERDVHVSVPTGETYVQITIKGHTHRLDKLGTGIQEIILVAAAAAFYSNRIVCIEEPEIHMHPTWLKRLTRQLFETENQYFISTHSSSIIDIPNVSVFQLEGSPDGTKVTHAVSARQKAEICESLGYKPSDLMQTNCIIWVEGPSDRIYINQWVFQRAKELVEGVHYTLMFYGGSLGTHITAEDLTNDDGELEYPEELEHLINVRKLNHRLAIVIDSDKKSENDKLTPVKERLIEEFDKGPGFAWLTGGRSIENYFEESAVLEAMGVIHKRTKDAKDEGKGKYRLLAKLKSKSGKKRDAKKVKIAEYLIDNNAPIRVELEQELELNMEKLINFIQTSNLNK